MKYASTSKSLRPYQQELLGNVRAALQCTDKPVMMQLPTGAGKTIIAAALLSKYLTGRRKAVWLTHRKELASQTENVLFKAGIQQDVQYQLEARNQGTQNRQWSCHSDGANGRSPYHGDSAAKTDVWGSYDARTT